MGFAFNFRKNSEIADIQCEGFKPAHAAVVKMAYGTDVGIFPHGDNAKQFATMVRYGISPIQAIQAVTINASEVFSNKRIGNIEAGRFADMIVVTGALTRDVRSLENVAVVIRAGLVIKNTVKWVHVM